MTYPNLEEISDYLKLLGVDNQIDTSANRIKKKIKLLFR